MFGAALWPVLWDGDICGMVTFVGTPVPPSSTGTSQQEMFSNTAHCGAGVPWKWQRGPDVSQGN